MSTPVSPARGVVAATYDEAKTSAGQATSASVSEEDAGEPVDAGLRRQLARERTSPSVSPEIERPEAHAPERERAGGLEPEAGSEPACRDRLSRPPTAIPTQPGDDEHGHSAASSSSSSCCSASDRAISSRPTSSNPKTWGSAAR